jgi:hypothetical protein
VAKVSRYDADQIEAGDTIAIKEGRIRRYYRVCEWHQNGDKIHIVYRGRDGFVHLHLSPTDRVRIRE